MKRTRGDKAKPVLSFTRRTDGVANKAMLDSFLTGLRAGTITYAHPRFALNRGNTKVCSYPVSPESVAAISWWSKDFANLVEAWPENAQVLNKYAHHFSFAINGPDHSILEPGLVSTLEQRMEQLRWLVDKCVELGQDPNASILVKVDPINVYTVEPDPRELDTLDHVPRLCEYLRALGLSRIHISFTQFFPATAARLDKIAKPGGVHIKELSPKASALELDEVVAAQRELLERKFIPYAEANGIKLQTCTAMLLVEYYRKQRQPGVIKGESEDRESVQLEVEPGGPIVSSEIDKSAPLIQGACVGWRDIKSITRGATKMAFQEKSSAKAMRFCNCYPHRDVGDKTEPCTNGCRYCFSNPKLYAF